MKIELEKEFIDNFIDKLYSDRLSFEFESLKKD